MAPTHTCPCQHCSQPLSFPAEMLGQEAACPHCGAATLLHDPAIGAPAAATPSERAWFYNLAGETHGPVAESALAALFAAGQLPAETWVWAEGEADWCPANTLATFQSAPPPPVPPKIPPKIPGKSAPASPGGLGQITARSTGGPVQFRPIGSASAGTGAAAPMSSFKPTGASSGSFSRFSGRQMLKFAGSALVVLLVVGGIVVKVVFKSGLLAKAPALAKIFGGGASLQDEVKNYLAFRDQQIQALNQAITSMPGGTFAPPPAMASALERTVIPVFEKSLQSYKDYKVSNAELQDVKQIEIGVAQQRLQAYRSLLDACKQQDRQQMKSPQGELNQAQQREREVQNKLREIGSKASVNIMFRPF